MKHYIAVHPTTLEAQSNIRTEPSTAAPIAGILNTLGRVAELIETENNWNHYQFSDSMRGWIRNDVHLYTPLKSVALDLPYVSQSDKDADQHINDCGVACMAGVLRTYGQYETVENLANWLGMKYSSLTTFDHINRLGRRYFVPAYTAARPHTPTQIIRNLDLMKVSITLVNYKYVAGKIFPHFVNIYGVDPESDSFLIHDPYDMRIPKLPITQMALAMRYTSENGNLPWQGIICTLPETRL